MSDKGRVAIVEELAAAWKLAGIRYAIVHGIDDYPEKIGRDLDILVHPDDAPRMLAAAHQVLAREDWIAVDPPDMWGKRIVAFSSEHGLEVHTVTGLSWREVELASTPRPAQCTELFPRDPWASYAKQILMPGFHGDMKKMRSNASALKLSDRERELVREALRTLVSPADESLAASLPEKSADELVQLLPRLRSSMIRRAWRRRPLWAAGSVAKKAGHRVDGLLRPTGVTVQLVAADGIDPHEIVEWVRSADTSVFTDFVFRTHGTQPSRSNLDLLIDAARGVWLRVLGDRAALSGQRVVFHVARADRSGPAQGGAVRRFSRWLDRIGTQPQATVVIGPTSTPIDGSKATAVSAGDPRIAAAAIVRVAIDAFIRRHSRSK